MNNLSLYLDLNQGVKLEQYQDLLRESKQYRLVKALAQPGPKYFHKVTATLRKAMIGLTALLRQIRHLPGLGPTNRAQV